VVFQVEYQTNLLQTNWLVLGSSVTAAGATLSLSDTIAGAGSGQRCYRLIASP